MEGFNNVPKILEEARRMVDAVTQSEKPDELPGTSESFSRQGEIAPPASLEAGIKPKKTSTKKSSAQMEPKTKSPARKKPRAKSEATAPPSDPATEKRIPEIPAALKAAVPPEKFGIRIIHRVPGRTRVKLRQMKYNPLFAKILEERLAIVPGIIAVETSTVTARAVLYYNPGVVCQPSAFIALQEAWQDLFPGMQTEKLVAEMTCQKL
jgi:hypothetical protein